MDSWLDVRRKARECHQAALAESNGDHSASALIAAALKIDDLEIRRYEPGTIVNKGVFGFLDRPSGLVNIAKDQDSADELVVIAHEIGHFRLHHDPISEVTVRSTGLGGDTVDSGAGKVEGYSPRERKEVQADVFAGEFFCPADWLREEFVARGKRPSQIAAALGVPPALVMNQLIRAVLLPPLRTPESVSPAPHYDLDDSQRTAATWSGGPLLVDAGPGTGKTRTLIQRIKHLLDLEASPASVLALTFSNKAAEEMRERLSQMNASAAIEMWVGTFHAFGLELVTKWPSNVGRTGRVKVLDQAGSLALLEDNLEKLPLNYYQNLHDPAFDLVNVLRAISRCKDELISPSEYLASAHAARKAAVTDEEKTSAEKTIEIAGIYQVYEEELKAADAVDFGDLIWLALRLVQENSEVKQYVSNFKHVLVDEYQDVNLASARLLRAICGPDTGVWVVADKRQSIYRFRGAEPSNVSRFEADFKGTRHSLGSNYRSYGAVVRTFERFSASMSSDAVMDGRWDPKRGEGGQVKLTVAPTLAAEAEAIQVNIEALRANGVRYADQVILARSHLTLARITGILEKLGVPLLYLGDLFERDEIRTLLSLIAIDAEVGGIGLVRAAALPAYKATRDDALAVIRCARTHRRTIYETLEHIAEVEGVSEEGRVGLAKLNAELNGLANASPWTLLTTWLFERSDYLRPLLAASDARSQQKLIAIYHLLKVCGEQLTAENLSRKRFLERIRRIEALNQDSAYSAVASEASDMDAVRVMTIHGSKGLEFAAVHLPALATRYMPANRQGNRCPPPPSLASLAIQPSDHDAEEACLFFVALSRARDFLSLSRAERYTTQNVSASKFLTPIASLVSTAQARGTGANYSLPIHSYSAPARTSYEERELALYMQCPAHYRYEIVEGLRGPRDESAYIQFHRCVYATVRWLENQKATGWSFDASTALAQFTVEWEANGPREHPFERYYRHAAEEMVSGMANTMAAESLQYDRQELTVPIAGRQVVIVPDRVLIAPDGTVHVQRIRTGRETIGEPSKPVYALLRRAAALKFPGKRVVVETFYLATRNKVEVLPKDDAKSLQAYADTITAIEAGQFEPEPDPRNCPRCECYFMCRG